MDQVREIWPYDSKLFTVIEEEVWEIWFYTFAVLNNITNNRR
jgi:hypothetical protein